MEIEPVHSNRYLAHQPVAPHNAAVDTCPIANDCGDPCGRPASALISFAICGRHAQALFMQVSKYMDGMSGNSVFLANLTVALNQQANGEAEARSRARAPEADQGTVYYVQIGHHIKIGHTIDLAHRMTAYGPVRRLLATERGGRQLEGIRHREFRDLLDVGREWFRPGDALIAHVNELRAAAGAEPIPDVAA